VIVDTSNEITRTISFSNDLVPIFNKSCNLSGCHSSGGKAPNLTSANAFGGLQIGNYINTTSPETSVIYQWMSGKKSTPMPVSGINKDYNAIRIAWIKQGAKNN
jgi:hypothetical protein